MGAVSTGPARRRWLDGCGARAAPTAGHSGHRSPPPAADEPVEGAADDNCGKLVSPGGQWPSREVTPAGPRDH